MRKIGQNPSILTVKGFDFDKYKKFLEKIDSYDDYKKADLSFADHFYAGAYTYLRRIFEKMINYYLRDTKIESKNMDTKISAVKDKFDPRINHLLEQLYSILSVSIHELDEEQSREYYSTPMYFYKADFSFDFNDKEKDNHKNGCTKGGGTRYIKWKKQAKEKITKLKHGELTEDEVYEWLQENK